MVEEIVAPDEMVDFINEMMERYKAKIPEFGESWRTCHQGYLERRINDTFVKYLQTGDKKLLPDLANFAWFLWAREQNGKK